VRSAVGFSSIPIYVNFGLLKISEKETLRTSKTGCSLKYNSLGLLLIFGDSMGFIAVVFLVEQLALFLE
jgi:hypothetical protein